MTKERALRILKSGYLKIQVVAKDMYTDDSPVSTKRMRLIWRIKNDSIGEEEINFIDKILK